MSELHIICDGDAQASHVFSFQQTEWIRFKIVSFLLLLYWIFGVELLLYLDLETDVPVLKKTNRNQ